MSKKTDELPVQYRDGKTIKKLNEPQPQAYQRQRLPVYDAAKDGNPYQWILAVAAQRRLKD